jgi:hypothetical protein
MRKWLAMLLVVSGCSGLKTYPTTAGGNLAVHTQMDANVRAALHIHRIDARCRTEYVGTVRLDRPSMVLSVPAGQPSYLVVEFDTSSFLGGNRSTAAGTLLNARPGNGYELAVKYRDSIYDVALSETDARTRQRHAMARRDLNECQARD